MELIERVEQLERELKALRPDLHFPSTATLEHRLRWLEIVMEEMRARDNHGLYAETSLEEKLKTIIAHTTYIKSDRITLHSLAGDPASCVAGDEWFRSDLGKAKLAIDAVVANAKLLRREGDTIPAAEIANLDAAKITTGRFVLARLPDGTLGQVLTGQGAGVDSAYTAVSAGLAIFGDGSDGNVTIASDTTLTRDMFYNNLTVNSGITLNTGGYRIFVKGTLTNNGTIRNNGGNGGNASTGVNGTAGAAAPGGSLGSGSAGGVGAGGQAGAGCPAGGGGGGSGGIVMICAKTIVNNSSIQANGGNGGNGASGTSAQNYTGANGVPPAGSLGGNGGNGGNGWGIGYGGTATPPTAAQGGYRAIPVAIMLKDETAEFTGGGGGGGGGTTNTAATDAGGGGGGGGGGLVFIYNTATWGTEQVNGGTGGAGAGAGPTGATGSVGKVIKIANG